LLPPLDGYVIETVTARSVNDETTHQDAIYSKLAGFFDLAQIGNKKTAHPLRNKRGLLQIK
jgi:hypothetical protein